MIDVAGIIKENARRKEEINKPYNPETGEGCQGERVCLKITDAPFPILWLPKPMMDESVCKELKRKKSIAALFKSVKEEMTDSDFVEFWLAFCELRIKYDYEYFAYLYETIEDGDSHEDIPFKLNYAQRDLLDIIESQRTNSIPIRIIILKARQLGLSTEVQLYMFWIQAVHKKNWHSVICAHELSASVTIRAMFNKVVENMPPINGKKYTISPFQNSQNIKIVPERGCRITVGTAERPESVRSQNPAMAHMSEVAFYPNTTKKGTAQLIGSIVGPMKRQPYTMLVYESTANGVGDYFHGEWEKSKKGESAFTPVFLPWYYKREYSAAFDGRYYNHSGKIEVGDIEGFVLSLDEYEQNLFFNHKRCLLENINWYRVKNAEMSSDEIMRQEYPSDDIEAFQDSGLPAFRSYHVESLRKDCMLPVSVGDLASDCPPSQAKTEPKKRKGILSNISFVEDAEALTAVKGSDPKVRERKERNKLKVWDFPDKTINVSNRYLVVFDPQKGLSENADWGVITVFDRYWMMHNGKPEIVAQWKGKIDKDITIWIAAQIASYYNNALLVVESNTYDSEHREDDSELIFDTIADCYNNLYSRTSSDKIKEGFPIKYGFNTNKSTKPMIISHFVIMLRERGYIEREEEALNEARVYEQKENGSYGAKVGKHDDILMTRMIGCYICYEMPLPVVIDDLPKYKTQKPVGHSSF